MTQLELILTWLELHDMTCVFAGHVITQTRPAKISKVNFLSSGAGLEFFTASFGKRGKQSYVIL